jgi:hypothetical protein
MIVEPFAHDRVEENLNPVGSVMYCASTMVCTRRHARRKLASRSAQKRVSLGCARSWPAADSSTSAAGWLSARDRQPEKSACSSNLLLQSVAGHRKIRLVITRSQAKASNSSRSLKPGQTSRVG